MSGPMWKCCGNWESESTASWIRTCLQRNEMRLWIEVLFVKCCCFGGDWGSFEWVRSCGMVVVGVT